MPRFLIRRVWGEIDEATMTANGRRSRQIGEESFPDVVWEHSHVTIDPEGRIVSFCVYQADGADRLVEHGSAVGGHFIDEIFEIGGDIAPGDFPPEPRHDHAR